MEEACPWKILNDQNLYRLSSIHVQDDVEPRQTPSSGFVLSSDDVIGSYCHICFYRSKWSGHVTQADFPSLYVPLQVCHEDLGRIEAIGKWTNLIMSL